MEPANRLKAHLSAWDLQAEQALVKGRFKFKPKLKKAKREQKVSPAFRAALCWVTSRDPAAPFEERAKRAETISKVGKKNSFKMPKKSSRERSALIWQRRMLHKRSEAAMDREPQVSRRCNDVVYI